MIGVEQGGFGVAGALIVVGVVFALAIFMGVKAILRRVMGRRILREVNEAYRRRNETTAPDGDDR